MVESGRRARALAVLAAAALAALGPSGALGQDRARVKALEACLIDDPATYQSLLRRAKAASTRDDRKTIADMEGAEAACAPTSRPHTYPEEVALPMPCGRRMLFRRVDTQGEDPLAQETGFFGDVEAEAGGDAFVLSTAPWTAPVSGPFALTDPQNAGKRAYYIGKYEVTTPQWALFDTGMFGLDLGRTAPGSQDCDAYESALVGDDGRRPNVKRVLPAADVSWFDAVAFSRAYSDWLVRFDRRRVGNGQAPATPWSKGSTGYVRPPTEAEWEFAARGGAAAAKSARAKKLPDMRDPDTGEAREVGRLEDVAFLESANTKGLLNGVGRRAPNKLNIYDTLGNVEEIALDLFRLVRPDGLHGQVGGFVARGGSSLSDAATLGVGARREIPLVTTDGAASSSVTGLRLVLSAPVFAAARATDAWAGGQLDRVYTEEALAARERLRQAGGDGDRSALLGELSSLRAGAGDDAQLRARVDEVRVLLEESNAKILEARRLSLRDRAMSAMAMAWAVRQTGQRMFVALRQLDTVLDRMRGAGRTSLEVREVKKTALDSVRRIDTELNAQFDIYLENLLSLADADRELLKDALGLAFTEVNRRGADAFGASPEWLQDHLARAIEASGELSAAERKDWLYQVDEFRQRRIDRFGRLE